MFVNKTAVLPELVQGACGGEAYLMKIMPPLYQTHLENQLSSSQLLFFSLIINVLQEVKSVSEDQLATTLPIPDFV